MGVGFQQNRGKNDKPEHFFPFLPSSKPDLQKAEIQKGGFMISHFPVGRFGTMKEMFFLIHNQIGTPSAICFAWDKLCLLDDLDYIFFTAAQG